MSRREMMQGVGSLAAGFSVGSVLVEMEAQGKIYPLADLKHIAWKASGRAPLDPEISGRYKELYKPEGVQNR